MVAEGKGGDGKRTPNGPVPELRGILRPDFTGQIILHCRDGRVEEYETRQKHQPREGEGIDLSE